MRGFVRATTLFGALAVAGAIAIGAAACATPPLTGDDCQLANARFAACGVVLPLLDGQPCTGIAKTIAECVNQLTHNCDDLASLSNRLDECSTVAANSLPPLDEDAPLPSTNEDAGIDGGLDGGILESNDGGSNDAAILAKDAGLPDAAVAPADLAQATAPDLAPVKWNGFQYTDTLALNQNDRYQTPTLGAGAYVFQLSGTGNADLYVRAGAEPTTTVYDCRPYADDSDESCTATLTSDEVIYLLVRGRKSSSAFTLTGHEAQ